MSTVDAYIGKPKAETIDDLTGPPKSESVNDLIGKPETRTLLDYLNADEPIADYVAADAADYERPQRHQGSVGIASPRTRVVPPSRSIDAYLTASAHTVMPSPQVTIGMDSADAFRNLDGGQCDDDPTTFWAVDSMPLLVSKFEQYVDGKKV